MFFFQNYGIQQSTLLNIYNSYCGNYLFHSDNSNSNTIKYLHHQKNYVNTYSTIYIRGGSEYRTIIYSNILNNSCNSYGIIQTYSNVTIELCNFIGNNGYLFDCFSSSVLYIDSCYFDIYSFTIVQPILKNSLILCV